MTRNQASNGKANTQPTVVRAETLHIAARARELAKRRLLLQSMPSSAEPLTTV
jgi:hypothetical protein